MDENPQFTITVIEGAYAGVGKTIFQDKISLGSSSSADLVIKDLGIADAHVSIEIIDQEFDVVALSDDVEIVGIGLMNKGDACTTEAPFVLKIGSAKIVVSPVDIGPKHVTEDGSFEDIQSIPIEAKKRQIGSWQAMIAIPVLALILLAFSVVEILSTKDNTTPLFSSDGSPIEFDKSSISQAKNAGLGSGNLDPSPAAQPDGDLKQASFDAPATTDDSPVGASAVLEPLRDLKAKLIETGVKHVDLEAGNETIVASGSVLKEDYQNWRDVQQWFDVEYGRRITLIPKTTVSENEVKMELPKIEAIWMGERPHIIMNGDKYIEGRALTDEWRIKSIQKSKVIFTYRGEPVEIGY
ncbi:MAG: EscD/YscD/HrpQ family type III secretion system periplasmic domain-containing protein [Pseudomonadota bacterium]